MASFWLRITSKLFSKFQRACPLSDLFSYHVVSDLSGLSALWPGLDLPILLTGMSFQLLRSLVPAHQWGLCSMCLLRRAFSDLLIQVNTIPKPPMLHHTLSSHVFLHQTCIVYNCFGYLLFTYLLSIFLPMTVNSTGTETSSHSRWVWSTDSAVRAHASIPHRRVKGMDGQNLSRQLLRMRMKERDQRAFLFFTARASTLLNLERMSATVLIIRYH